MSDHLQAHVDDYLRLRRAVGFELKEEERLLAHLVRYLEGRRRDDGHQRAGDQLGAPA
jgi:hypothetical protein